MTQTFDTSHRATKGARRYQEDACVFARLHVAPEVADAASSSPAALVDVGVVAVLADGMGGHVGGERASAAACRGFLDALSSISGEASDYLEAALSSANEAIRREIAVEPGLHGMGCTLVGVVVDPIGLRWVSVGDSRLLLFRAGELYQLNEDHSLGPMLDRLVEQGELSREEAQNHPRRHHLRSALTGEQIELVDLARERVELQTGDIIIVASDGLDTLTPDEIADLIDAHRGRGAEAVASALIDAVDGAARPGQDNTTVMAVAVHT